MASVPAAAPHPAAGDPGEIAAANPTGSGFPCGVLISADAFARTQ